MVVKVTSQSEVRVEVTDFGNNAYDIRIHQSQVYGNEIADVTLHLSLDTWEELKAIVESEVNDGKEEQ